jgi:hypothetical protein
LRNETGTSSCMHDTREPGSSRQVPTSDPADKSDRDVMEVVIDLDGKPEHLPIGLRVSVLFLE